MKKEKNDISYDYAIFRTKFEILLSNEINKIQKFKKNKTNTDYLKMIVGLKKELRNYSIKSQDLKANYLAFLKVKKEYQLKRVVWWIVGGFLLFFIIILSITIPFLI
ncbi:hypothetical protein [Mycoplasmopsis felis]|uniref:hypothetical protein n=1 Tax=Mycoplasmopsis felis TaxID=33923 RepID=UPI002AFE08D2|nr:hypothetical protein [Mycoplasmopsis felis]WQQ03507.1 hypothetical protein RRG38_01455 [Mycoplasmopsis felis]WQQ04420.1 hypothetical protein RRG55_02470 [Mycoplasmopsis felis]